MLQLISADRLFDGDGHTIVNGGVVVDGSRIVAVGPAAALRPAYAGTTLDEHPYPGCTLLPGLIDAHTHLIMPGTGEGIVEWARQPDAALLMTAARNLWLSAQAGVTTVADFGAKDGLVFDLRATQEAGILGGARVIACGRALTITGGHAWPWGGEADGVDGVRTAVRQLCKEGADFIKVMTTGGGTPGTDGRRPSYTLVELEAIVDEAHARNRKVAGHCTATAGIARAVEAGFDLIAHCQFLTPAGPTQYDADLAQRIADSGIYVNPTLQVNRILTSHRVDWAAMSPARQAALRAWNARYPEFAEAFFAMHTLGVRMVCGSDCGWGYAAFGETYLELDAMVEAGLTPAEALLTATGHAADALGWGDRIGRLQPGYLADLLVVEGDPTTHVADLANVRGVWLDGAPHLDSAGFVPIVPPWATTTAAHG